MSTDRRRKAGRSERRSRESERSERRQRQQAARRERRANRRRAQRAAEAQSTNNPGNPGVQTPEQQIPTQQEMTGQPTQQPVIEQQPIPSQQPVTQQQPIAGQQQPMPSQQPVAQQQPIAGQQQQPVPSQQSTIQQPVTEQQPMTEQQPVTGEQWSVQQPTTPPAATTAAGQPSQQPYGGAFAAGIPQATPVQSQLGAAPQAGASQLASQPSELYPEAFADHLTDEARECLDDCIDVSQVAAWSADRCLEQGPQYAQCARLCNDVSHLGSVAAQFMSKDAITLPTVLEAYIDTAEAAVDELSKFDTTHTNEAEMVIQRSLDSSYEALDNF